MLTKSTVEALNPRCTACYLDRQYSSLFYDVTITNNSPQFVHLLALWYFTILMIYTLIASMMSLILVKTPSLACIWDRFLRIRSFLLFGCTFRQQCNPWWESIRMKSLPVWLRRLPCSIQLGCNTIPSSDAWLQIAFERNPSSWFTWRGCEVRQSLELHSHTSQ